MFIEVITECWKLEILQGESPYRIAISAWSLVHGFSLLVIDGHLQGEALNADSLESMKRGLLYSLYAGIRGKNGPGGIQPSAGNA